ncbi:MAG: DUF5615 family PIN-like protein [Bryobacteraceae bacterium]
MKLLIDMNLSPQWVEFLTNRGLPSIHWSSIGVASAPDVEIMDYATANGFVVFTNDLDFSRILALRGGTSPSVVQVRTQDLLPDAVGELVVRAFEASRSYLEAGALVTVDLLQSRIRLLPISARS